MSTGGITVFGIPAAFVVLGVGALLVIIGWRWIIRIYADDPSDTMQSFRATADRGLNVRAWSIVTGVILLLVAVAIAIAWEIFRLSSNGTT